MKELLKDEDFDDFGSKRYMLVSDTHFSRPDVDVPKTVGKLLQYGEDYECDELVLGGDISKDPKEVTYLINGNVFDGFKIAKGNHDHWDPTDLYKEIRSRAPEARNAFVAEKLEWEDGGIFGEYLLSLSHKPQEFKIRSSTTESKFDYHEDIILYGHSHAPHDRVMGKGTLFVGIGSAFSNYNTPFKNNHIMADRSFQIMNIGEKIYIEHYDFDTEELVESSEYIFTNEGFQNTFKEGYLEGLYEEEAEAYNYNTVAIT